MAGKGLTPAQIAQKWSRNLQNAKESMKAGAEAVKDAPTEKAAQAVDAYKRGVQQAADSGKYQRNLRKVSREDWIRSYVDKGLKNLDNGLKEGEKKQSRFMEEFMPFIEAESEKIQRMDKGGRANALARITANLDALERFKQQRRG